VPQKGCGKRKTQSAIKNKIKTAGKTGGFNFVKGVL